MYFGSSNLGESLEKIARILKQVKTIDCVSGFH